MQKEESTEDLLLKAWNVMDIRNQIEEIARDFENDNFIMVQIDLAERISRVRSRYPADDVEIGNLRDLVIKKREERWKKELSREPLLCEKLFRALNK